MTKKIELLDALPGCGKTYAITKYMAENRQRPWLYLTPLASEVYGDEGSGNGGIVVSQAGEHGLGLYTPTELSDATKTQQVLEFLEEGYDVACTHNLMLRFTKKHIAAIKKHGYNVVCDETLDLLSAYNMEKDDFDFLKQHDLISVEPSNGRVSFKDVDMGNKARYADVKLLCDLGCLFSAPRSERMLVTQLSTDLIRECNRFILITYNYKGSLMDNFLSLHGFSFENIQGITTRFQNKEAKRKLVSLLTFIETPSVLKYHSSKSSMNMFSKSWWMNASKVERDTAISTIVGCATKAKATKKKDIIFTVPSFIVKPARSNSYKMPSKNLSKDSWVACNCRATNEYASAKLAVQAYNLYPNVAVVSYLQDMGCKIDQDNFALNMMIQWIWRGCIRNGEPMSVAILPKRMSIIFKEWLMQVDME